MNFRMATLGLSLGRVAPVFVLAALFLTASRGASAATYWWAGPSGVLWSSTTSWSMVADAATPNQLAFPVAADIAVFNVSTVTDPPTVYLNGNQAALGLSFISSGSTTIIGGTAGAVAANSLTLGSGVITLAPSAGPVAISTTGTLSNSGTYTLAAGTQLSVSSPLAGGLRAVGSGTMTFSGGGTITTRGVIGDGGNNLTPSARPAARSRSQTTSI